MAGPWLEGVPFATGEVRDTNTPIITHTNAAMQLHDPKAVMQGTGAVRHWLDLALLADLLVACPDEAMSSWRGGEQQMARLGRACSKAKIGSGADMIGEQRQHLYVEVQTKPEARDLYVTDVAARAASGFDQSRIDTRLTCPP
jgi:hypothetical protein